MSQYFYIHPDNPQTRLINLSVDIIRKGGLIVYPTDSSYALGCHINNTAAINRIKKIRQVNDKHKFTLMCRDISVISQYAKVDNINYRLLKTLTPGPYTFILEATREVPRKIKHHTRKTIGMRVPENTIALDLLEALEEPLLTTTLELPHDDLPLTDPYQIKLFLENQVDLIIDGGFCNHEPTTVIDLIPSQPQVIRQGIGDTSWLKAH